MYDDLLAIEIASLGNITAMQEFIDSNRRFNSLNLNVQDDFGNTAAIAAASRNDLAMLKTLVKNGADLSLKDTHGRTAESIAKDYNYTEMLKFIELHMAKIKKNENSSHLEILSNSKLTTLHNQQH